MKKKIIVLKSFLIILAFTLSTNINAATININALNSTTTVSTAAFNSASINMHSLTWGHINWDKLIDWIKNKICSRCGSRCGGTCGVPTPGGGQGGNPSIPLDGGLSILALGAAAFGIRKLRKDKND